MTDALFEVPSRTPPMTARVEAVMERTHATKELISRVLGINQARVAEWLNDGKPVPEEAAIMLERWERAGCPSFEFWMTGSRG